MHLKINLINLKVNLILNTIFKHILNEISFLQSKFFIIFYII
jgi:hypothetical protein